MKQIASALRRTKFGAVAALFLLIAVATALPAHKASAGGLLYRSLELSSTAPGDQAILDAQGNNYAPGTGANGKKVGHTYIFQTPTAVALNALVFTYCSGPFEYLAFASSGGGTGCALPTGLDISHAGTATVATYASLSNAQTATSSVASQTYNVDAAHSTAATKELVMTPASTTITPTAVQFVRVTFAASGTNYFTNPNATWTNGLTPASRTFFVHVQNYASAATVDTVAPTDEGTVTNSVNNTIDINTRVQETLNFSVEANGGSGPSTVEGAGCAALTGTGGMSIGDPTNSYALDTGKVYDGVSYFRLATNSSKGAQVLYSGDTLKSTAGDQIDPLGASATASAHGTSQFGLAISSNDTSNDVVTPATSNTLTPVTPYDAGATGNTSNNANGTYAFQTASNTVPVQLAGSTGIVSCDTGVVRYIANISPDTPAGLYSTKISYIAVPSY